MNCVMQFIFLRSVPLCSILLRNTFANTKRGKNIARDSRPAPTYSKLLTTVGCIFPTKIKRTTLRITCTPYRNSCNVSEVSNTTEVFASNKYIYSQKVIAGFVRKKPCSGNAIYYTSSICVDCQCGAGDFFILKIIIYFKLFPFSVNMGKKRMIGVGAFCISGVAVFCIFGSPTLVYAAIIV